MQSLLRPASTNDTPACRRDFEKQLVAILPDLKRFARSLTRNNSTADDLIQDTTIRALRSYQQFEIGTNIKAYVFKIMRNCFLSDLRDQRMEFVADDGEILISVPPGQDSKIELDEVTRALNGLVPAHREVISLIRLNGYSYGDAANIMRCGLGTIKSRMNRADTALRAALGPEFERRGSTAAEPTAPSRRSSRVPAPAVEMEYAL